MNIGSIIRAIDRRGPRRRTPYAVLRALAEHVDNQGVCFPGHARLASKCRLTQRSVVAALAWLNDAGWIVIEHGAGMPGKNGRGRTNRYRINLARLGCSSFTESSSSESYSREENSHEASSCGNPVEDCGNPRKSCGNPVEPSSSSEMVSREIHCIPPAPPNRKKVRTKYIKATAKAETKADYDGRLVHLSPTPATDSQRYRRVQ